MKNEEYVIVDIETTGLSRYRHNITEIAAVRVKNNKIVGEFQMLVNPLKPIPRFITRLTGITDEMVKDAQPIEKVLPVFLEFLGSSVLVAHNATFDYGFINYNAEQYLGLLVENERLCTRKLANRLLPALGSKKLSNLCEHFGIVNITAHRAMSDVKATHELFSKFIFLMDSIGLKDKKSVLKFEKSPIKHNMNFN
ncbi:3'-5' exonuclease [Candidatus Woesearchaeota archaeon]|nr:3'-5' exonuclease [Candidatus Woesearchaeota archaeon]MBL7051135.1 3'-5' exonuclease [Candidatus Woesearchaeota archaeon]